MDGTVPLYIYKESYLICISDTEHKMAMNEIKQKSFEQLNNHAQAIAAMGLVSHEDDHFEIALPTRADGN